MITFQVTSYIVHSFGVGHLSTTFATMHSIFALTLLTTPIHAATTARVWTHFYPSCPGEPFADLASYENYEEITPATNVPTGQCVNIGVPSYEHDLVSALSVDAELVSHINGSPFSEGPSNCNITVHEVPECEDTPLITKELRNGVEVSQCESRRFAAYSEVWLQLVCNDESRESLEEQAEDIPRIDETAKIQQASDVQTPGSTAETWHLAQATQSEREPVQEGRVNNAGHLESEKIVHAIMEALKKKHATLVTGKHNSTATHHRPLNGTHRPLNGIHRPLNGTLTLHNGTAVAGNRTMSRRKLSVLRNRAPRLI